MRLVLTMLGEPVYQEVGSTDRLLFLTSRTCRLGAVARSLGTDPAGAQHSVCWQHEGLCQWWQASAFLCICRAARQVARHAHLQLACSKSERSITGSSVRDAGYKI